MRTADEIFRKIEIEKPPIFRSYLEAAVIGIKAIRIAQTEAWNEGAIEELTKAKCLTEHLNQQERNEYFETRLKKLAE